MEFTGPHSAPQSLQHQNGAECAEWLQQLHHRVADRCPHAWIRQALHYYCRTEAKVVAGWPSFRLAGELPPGYHGDPYVISTQYRQALAAVLKELAQPGALEVDLPRPPCDLPAMLKQGGMLK